ncbi:MAG: type II toxin-antitoxin system HicA family toxin [Novosphingobium sp.]|uniref:type II toxin-antitoxin system HicA family toxin n=1 Tax=Novosphingobium sp. TaxID=1874826 RepID=UPI003B990EB2
MTQIDKLFTRILASPQKSLSCRDFERLLSAFGFIHVRTKGSHQAWHHPDATRPLIIQPRGKDAKPYQVQQFLDMIEELGLKLDE